MNLINTLIKHMFTLAVMILAPYAIIIATMEIVGFVVRIKRYFRQWVSEND